MINATLARLGCVGGDWMIRGGVERRESNAERSAGVVVLGGFEAYCLE